MNPGSAGPKRAVGGFEAKPVARIARLGLEPVDARVANLGGPMIALRQRNHSQGPLTAADAYLHDFAQLALSDEAIEDPLVGRLGKIGQPKRLNTVCSRQLRTPAQPRTETSISPTDSFGQGGNAN